jgi:hypothetical protein
MVREKYEIFHSIQRIPARSADNQSLLRGPELLACSLLSEQLHCLAVAVSGLLGSLGLSFFGFLKSRLGSGTDLNGVLRGFWCNCCLRGSLFLTRSG